MKRVVSVVILCWGVLQAQTQDVKLGVVKRDVLGLYYRTPEQVEQDPGGQSAIEQYAEMPLNHLGIRLIPYNLADGPPDFSRYPNLLGILAWFESSFSVPYLDQFIESVVEQIDRGVKFVSLGDLAFPSDIPMQYYQGVDRSNRILQKVGLDYEGMWVSRLYDVTFTSNNLRVAPFERAIQGSTIPYMILKPYSQDLEVDVLAHDLQTESYTPIVSYHPHGAIVLPGYGMYTRYDPASDQEERAWLINPFVFFEKAFGVSDDPKFDTTTLSGRRLYFSHIDGDGYYSLSLIPGYVERGAYCAEVILEEVLRPYPHLPVTMGVIGAEMDFSWVGRKKGVEIAKQMFALDHIEAASHSFSHPFDWSFFEHYQPMKEEKYLAKYPDGGFTDFTQKNRPQQSESVSLYDKFSRVVGKIFPGNRAIEPYALESDGEEQAFAYTIPRYYAKMPFDLTLETKGAIQTIDEIAPGEKKCALYQWSGDCKPFEQAIEMVRKAGVPNINGGDSRFDTKYPSYGFLAPLGRLVGQERQIYAVTSNENTYTALWQDEFFGFKDLPETLKNTNTPIRVKPASLYYHTYSGERWSSLKALLSNLAFIQTQKVCPVETSYYAKMAHDFYEATIDRIAPNTYQVLHRGLLQTVRFDHATFKRVDWEKSKGVLGQTHLHGSLYVALDARVDVPTIAIREDHFGDKVKESVVYLIESNCRVHSLEFHDVGMSFRTRGFGEGSYVWHVAEPGVYRVRYSYLTHDVEFEVASQGHQLEFTLPQGHVMQENLIQVEKVRGVAV